VTCPGCLKIASEWLQPSGAGFAALLLVLAAGLGYVFSLIHHTLFSLCGWYGIDYSAFLQDAVDRNWLRLVPYGHQEDGPEEKVTCREGQKDAGSAKKVTRRDAWDVIALLWYRSGKAENAKAPEMGQALISRADGISDLIHSLGTSFIAALGVPVTWGVLYWFSLCPPSDLDFRRGVVLVGVLIGLHISNYLRTRNFLVRLVKNALAMHFAAVETPLKIYINRT